MLWRDHALLGLTTKISERVSKLPSYLSALGDVVRRKDALLQHCHDVAFQYGRGLLEQKRRTLWDQVCARSKRGPSATRAVPLAAYERHGWPATRWPSAC